MSRKIIIFIGFISLLSFTSCIDLLNELKINPDKSGTAFIGIEAKALGMLANLGGEYVDEKTKNEIIGFPLEAAAILQGINGISEVKALSKIYQGRLGVSFHFDNPKALNNAYYALSQKDRKWYYPDLVKIKKHKVKLRNLTPFINHYLNQQQDSKLNDQMIKYVNYRTVIELPKSIKPNSVKYGDVNTDGVILTYVIPLREMVTNKQSTGNKVRY